MTTATETKTTEKKAPPVADAVPFLADGKGLNFEKKIPIWPTKGGKIATFTVPAAGAYALVMRKQKSATEGKSA